MARQRGPRFKVARRFGVNVCGHPKALKRGPKPTKKMSEYGKQLLEKQKLKAYYDVLEKQFAKYVEDALKSQENPGEKLILRLEMRLDNMTSKTNSKSRTPSCKWKESRHPFIQSFCR